MPKELEEKLRREAKKKGLEGKRLNAYVYGNQTMQEYLHPDLQDKKKKKK